MVSLVALRRGYVGGGGMRIGTRIAIGVIIALAVVALISTLSASGARHLIHAAGRVDHTNVLIRDLDEALSSLIAVQTGVRGYVIAGQPEPLALEHARPVVECVREYVHLCVLPCDELAVHPDEVRGLHVVPP